MRFLLCVLAVLTCLAGAAPAYAKARKMKLSRTVVTLTKGKTTRVTVKGSYKKIRVKASKKGYVKVTVKKKKIKIKALKAGTVKLTIKGYNKKGKLKGKGTIRVIIKKKKTTKKTTPTPTPTAKPKKVTPTPEPYIYNKESASVFLKAVKKVADMARKNGWTYDDSSATPPCSDGVISCDRIIARALYDLGYMEQPTGGITIHNGIASYLAGWGFVKTTKKSEIKAGAVVAVKSDSTGQIAHVFVVSKYNASTGICDKYDTGSNSRIRTVQPFTDVYLDEWSNKSFLYAYNVPYALMGTAAYANRKVNAAETTWNGVDYAPVYNYDFYRTNYADLRKEFGYDKQAYFEHFVTYGMSEGRVACAGFNVSHYKKRYSDLRQMYGTFLPDYYTHYCTTGKAEGRNGL